MNCPHSDIEKSRASYLGGKCPLCLKVEVEELKKDKSHLEDIESDLNSTLSFAQRGVDMWKGQAEQLQAEVEGLKKAIRIAKIKLGVIEIRAKDRRPMGSKGDKPIWITAKNGLKEIEQALKGKVK